MSIDAQIEQFDLRRIFEYSRNVMVCTPGATKTDYLIIRVLRNKQ